MNSFCCCAAATKAAKAVILKRLKNSPASGGQNERKNLRLRPSSSPRRP
uniref:Uncharacterized protein n=1 Tax=Pseudomonas putida TaxID=303 RepID=A0A1W6QY79_PSEPU|nr:Hypothetical protein [Pseudomonas putida]